MTRAEEIRGEQQALIDKYTNGPRRQCLSECEPPKQTEIQSELAHYTADEIVDAVADAVCAEAVAACKGLLVAAFILCVMAMIFG
jgi:hypothetical protein